MEIVKYGHPCLRWKSKPFTSLPAGLKEGVRKMFDLMYEARGIGLAANQVGLPYRLFVVNETADPEEADAELVFINPTILRRKGSERGEEGCLSLPELYGTVPRATDIVVEAFDVNGEGYELQADGLLARVIQHETDHLDGVLFIDRMDKDEVEEFGRSLESFEAEFQRLQTEGHFGSVDEIKLRLAELEKSFEFPE